MLIAQAAPSAARYRLYCFAIRIPVSRLILYRWPYEGCLFFCVYISQNKRLGASCLIRRLWFLLSLFYHSSTVEVVWCLLVEEYIQLLDVEACIIIWPHRIRWGKCACVGENNVLRQMHCAGDYRKKIELKGYFALHFENFYYICVTKLWESFFW